MTITPSDGISLTWRVAGLAPGMGGVITLTGVVDSQIVGRQTFVNTARIGGTLGEVTLANNVAAVEVMVAPGRWGLWLPLVWRGP